MPAPTPVVWDAANPVVQIVEEHSVGDAGWTEVYHLSCPAAGDPLFTALTRHQVITTARRAAIPEGHIIETLRVSDVAIFGDSRLKFPPGYGLGEGNLLGMPVTNPALGYFVNQSDQTGTIGDTRIYRGWGTTQINYAPDAPRATPPPGAVAASLQLIANELVTTRSTLGVNTTYVLRSFRRPEEVGGPVVRNGMRVTVNSEANLQFITSDPLPPGWVAGARIKVRANRMRCVRGVSGTHTITAIEIVGAVATVVTDTPYNCNPSTLGPLVAAGYLVILAFYPIKFVEIGGAGKRATGRPLYLTRGRRRARV